MQEELTSNKRIMGGAFVSYAAIALDILLGIIYTPWMIRQIGQSDYGVYSLALSVIAMITMDFGIGSATTKYLCEYRVSGEEDKLNRLLGVTFRLYLIIDAVIAAVMIVLYFSISGIYIQLSPTEIERFKVVFLISGLVCVFAFPFAPLNGVLTSYEKFTQLRLFNILSRVIITALTVAALLMGKGLYALVLINALTSLLIFFLKWLMVTRQTRVKLTVTVWDREIVKKIFQFSVWITLMTLLKQMTLNFCPSVLGIVSTGTNAIAAFNVGKIIYTYATTLTSGINGLFLLRVTKLNAEADREDTITKLMIRVGRIQLVLSSLIITGALLFGREFFGLWIGKEYADSFHVSQLLMLPMLVITTQEIANTYIVVLNKVRLWVIVDAVVALTCIILSFTLGRNFGAVGAAAAYFIASTLGYIVVMNIIFARVLKLKIKRFFVSCHLKLLPPVLGAALFGYVIRLLLPSGNYGFLSIKVLLFSGVFTVMIWVFGLDAGEKGLVRNALKKIRQKIGRAG